MAPTSDPFSGRVDERLLVVGDLCFDYYLKIAPQPWPDEKANAQQTLRMVGGSGANAAAAASRLGTPVSLIAPVGDDPIGRWLSDSMKWQGVDVSGVTTIPGNSTQATLLLDGSSRCVIIDRGVLDKWPDIDGSRIAEATMVYVCGSPAAVVQLVGQGLSDRMIVGVEAWMVEAPKLVDALADVKLVIMNSAGWAVFGPRLAGRVVVVETKGKDGSAIHQLDGSTCLVITLPVDAVDATGAGDCFAGSLCHYLLRGSSLVDACELASIAAGLSTQALGAQSALPAADEVQTAVINRGFGT